MNKLLIIFSFILISILHLLVLNKKIFLKNPETVTDNQTIKLTSVILQEPKKIKKIPKKPKKKTVPTISEKVESIVDTTLIVEEETYETANIEEVTSEISIESATSDLKEKTNQIKSNYILKLQQIVNSNVKYPRRAIRRNQTGIVMLAFDVYKDGSIKNKRISSKSEYPILDKAAYKALDKINYFDSFPLESELEMLSVEFPVTFELEE